ncbi:Hypothetical predicted protein, partial [Pelobates cultripes]
MMESTNRPPMMTVGSLRKAGDFLRDPREPGRSEEAKSSLSTTRAIGKLEGLRPKGVVFCQQQETKQHGERAICKVLVTKCSFVMPKMMGRRRSSFPHPAGVTHPPETSKQHNPPTAPSLGGNNNPLMNLIDCVETALNDGFTMMLF